MAAALPTRPFRRAVSPILVLAISLASTACGLGDGGSGAANASPPLATVTLPTDAPAATFPLSLSDDEGTDVAIPSKPQKIVSLTPSSTEVLYAIGAGSRVVAKVEDIANYPPEAAAVPVVATFSGVDVEKIVSLEADLVISGGAGLTQGDAVEQLRRAGIPVLVVYPTTVDGALAGVRLIGQAVGEADAATDLAADMERRISDLSAIASTAATQPRVFYEIDVSNGIFTPPAASIYGEMFQLAGGDPISGDPSYSISLENLVAADPEVILLGDAAYGQTAETVKARSGWKGMTAVKQDRIYPIDDIVVTRPGPRLVDGLVALIKAIHPELDIEGAADASDAPVSSWWVGGLRPAA